VGLAVLSALAAVVGAWAWWYLRSSQGFWWVVRASQAVAIVLAVTAGIAAAAGHRPDDGLFWVYALTPVVVSFVGEQLRIVSAQTILDARGLADAQAVGALPDTEQRSIVTAIVRREVGVMALAAGVTCFLALRAVATVPGL
jgi:hypothetical protein